MLKAPKFWYEKPGILAFLLSPLGWLYSLLSRILRIFSASPYRASIPVISIGNIVMGGAGKTPTSIELARLLKHKGYNPMVVSRGYGGKLKGPILVNPKQHNYSDVGDEALLLCRAAPTVVSKNRKLGVKMAEEKGADVIILDDALQNNQVVKDVSLVVVGQVQKFGNEKVFPAGPLREPISWGLKKADAIVYLGREDYSYKDLPVVYGQVQTKMFPFAGQRIVAFCGIGYPDKFKESLLGMGCTLDKFITFPDHYPYTEADMDNLIRHSYGLPVVTTSKDFTRIPSLYESMINVMEIELKFNEPEKVLELLR